MSQPTILSDVFTESADGQYIELDLVNPATGLAISTAAIVSLTGTLRSLDTDDVFFSAANLIASSRSSYPGTAGRVRITFTAADMAAIGPRDVQRRELTVKVVHSTDKVFVAAVRFTLANLKDAPVA